MVYVGHSRHSDSATAGRECAEEVREAMIGDEAATWALAFCGGRHDPEAMFEALREELGGVPVVGGSAIGTITGGDVGYTGFEYAVAVFSGSLPAPAILVERGLDAGERELGARLGARLRDAVAGDNVVLLFYDSVASPPPPILHPASLLLDGLYDVLGVHLVGAGTVSDFQIEAAGLSDRIVDLGGGFGDFAAAVAALDLVVSVDTAVVHLAGAMARPVWTLLPFAPDWRWLRDRSDSPWCPTMRLFRQKKAGEWKGVFTALGRALKAQAAPPRKPRPKRRKKGS